MFVIIKWPLDALLKNIFAEKYCYGLTGTVRGSATQHFDKNCYQRRKITEIFDAVYTQKKNYIKNFSGPE